MGDSNFLYYFNTETQSLKVTNLSLSDMGVTNSRLRVIDADVVCYGFTGGTDDKYVLTEGYFIRILSLNGELLFSESRKFSDDFYKYKQSDPADIDHVSLRNKKRNFILGNLFKNDKGDLLFTAEQFTFYISNYGSSASPGSSGSSLNYTNGAIVVISCSNDGVLNWTKRFFKTEAYDREGDFLSSYFAQLKGNNLHIIINDNLYRTNEKMYNDLGKKEVARAVRHNIVSEIIIDENGQSERNLLIDIDNDEDQENSVEAKLKGKLIAPRTFYITEDGTVVFFGRYLETSGISIGRHDNHFIRMGRMPLN